MQLLYQHLQPEDRISIESMSQQGCGVRAISRMLHRAPRNVLHEIERHTRLGRVRGFYLAQSFWHIQSLRTDRSLC